MHCVHRHSSPSHCRRRHYNNIWSVWVYVNINISRSIWSNLRERNSHWRFASHRWMKESNWIPSGSTAREEREKRQIEKTIRHMWWHPEESNEQRTDHYCSFCVFRFSLSTTTNIWSSTMMPILEQSPAHHHLHGHAHQSFYSPSPQEQQHTPELSGKMQLTLILPNGVPTVLNVDAK